jgi:hypothetical protein
VVSSLLRPNAAVKCDPNDVSGVKPKDNIILLLDAEGRKFSVATRLEAIEEESGADPVIQVDSRILGQIAAGDQVDIIPYNIPFAEKIEIAIEQKTRIFDGDWTPNARGPLQDKVIDYGNPVPLTIPFATGPVSFAGKIATSIPKCPVCIGPQTKIFLKKYSPQQWDILVQDALKEKEHRAAVLLEELQLHSLEGIAALKSTVTAYAGDTYSFANTEPAGLFEALKSVLAGFKPLEQPKENVTEESYVASACYYSLDSSRKVKNVIELQVTASGYSGKTVVSVYSKKEMDSRGLLSILQGKIEDLQSGLQERVETGECKCPNCGADRLPIEKADAEGYVKCDFCKQRQLIPKRLRH